MTKFGHLLLALRFLDYRLSILFFGHVSRNSTRRYAVHEYYAFEPPYNDSVNPKTAKFRRAIGAG
jgi:hypothetical protein